MHYSGDYRNYLSGSGSSEAGSSIAHAGGENILAREVGVRVPFSIDVGMQIEKEAQEMNLSYSSYLRLLIEKGRRESLGSEPSSLFREYRMGYEKYFVVYVTKEMDVEIKAIAPEMESSKIYSCLAQKGRDTI